MKIQQISEEAKKISGLKSVYSKAAPKLEQHVEEAQTIANDWLNSQSKSVLASLNNTNSACNSWSKIFLKIKSLSTDINTNVNQIKSLLRQINKDLSDAKKTLNAIIPTLNNLDSQIAHNVGNLVNDSTLISNKISSDKSVISKLKGQISHAESKVKAYDKRKKIEEDILEPWKI